MKLKVPLTYVTNYPHKQNRLQKKEKKTGKGPKCWYSGAKSIMAALYRNATNYTVSFDSAASQVQVINHSFKKHSVKLQIKSQLTLQVRQSCSQAVPSALHLPSERFSISDFFKGLLLSGGPLFSMTFGVQ